MGSAVRLCIILFCLGVFTELAAYTDPGSGLLMWQILVGTFAGASFLLRKFIRKLIRRAPDTPPEESAKQ